MIKKAQGIFILITTLIVFLVLSSIYVVITVYQSQSLSDISGIILDETARSYDPYSPFYKIRGNGVIINVKTKEIKYDENTLTFEQVKKMVDSIKETEFNENTLYRSENVFYIYKIIQGNPYVIMTDMSANYNVIHSTNVKTLFILIFIFFSLFSLIVILSKYVFKPIKESFDKQNRFISDASHELKTPITIISANADVLSQDNKDNDWVENIKSQTKRLDYLVKDLLSLAKLNETKLTLNKTNVNLSDEVLNEVLQFDALAFEKEKILSTDISPNINANIDIVSLKKVLNILMDNAIKYSSIKGEIKVSLKKEKTKIKLTVFNSGSSVPDELSDKLFERFFRVEDSRSRESGGSGLGLSIAKRICILNKWKITAQSKLNDSMKITVVL